MDACLSFHYEKMHFFFNDYNLGYISGRVLERKLLSYIKLKLFNDGDTICDQGEKFVSLYMMAKNTTSKVIVMSKEFNLNLAVLKHGSFFGDASLLFDVPSKYKY